MKWFMMLLIFIGGIYYLVVQRENKLRDEASAKAAATESIRTATEAALPLKTEKLYTMRFSLQTIKTLRSLTTDTNEKVRFASVELLWQLQDDQAPALIKRMFQEETEPEVKKLLIGMLAKDKSKLSLALLAEALNDYDKNTRLLAVQAAGTFSSKEALIVLTKGMQDYDDDVRLKSVQAVNQLRRDIELNKEQQIKEVTKEPLFKVE